MADLSDWLNHLGLGAYTAVFADEGFEDVDNLRNLTGCSLARLDLKNLIPQLQALLTLRALRLAARVPSIDTARWKELARSVLESLPPQHTLTLELSDWAR